MKKFITCLLLLVLYIGFMNPANAFGEIDKKIVRDATLQDVENIVKETLKTYEGVITITRADEKAHLYNVNYNGSTPLSYWGISNKTWASDKFVKARMSCKIKQLNDKDVLLVCTRNSSGFNLIIFRHYKKIHQALEFEGYKVEPYAK